jgi:hypothetical protein
MDWKRTAKTADWKETQEGYSFSSNIMKYSIQMAAYYKLLTMELELKGEKQRIKREAILVVFHPSNHSFQLTHLDLDKPMNAKSVKTTKGVADRVNQLGEVEPWIYPLSPIEYVEALFEKRLEHLKRHFL